jgi:hypothetical protein
MLGEEKIGKSTFAASSNNPIFIPVKGEEGIDDLTVDQFPTCLSHYDVISCLQSLHTQEHNFGTVCIDSSTSYEPLIWDAVCREHGGKDGAAVNTIEEVLGGYHKGYTVALNYWRAMTEWLDALRSDRNMASILIGHVKIKRFDDPTSGASYDQFQWALDAKAANLLFCWADVILFARTKTAVAKEDVGFNKKVARGVDTGGGNRFLFTKKTPAHPGGGRGVYGRLPDELPLSWEAFTQAVATALQQPQPA